MKRLILVIVMVLTLIACNDIGGYITGRSMYYSIEATVSDSVVDKLENLFNKLLDDTQGAAAATPEQTMSMFNDLIMILALETSNPYGLVGDMTFFLSDAGAEYNAGGKMIDVGLIPRSYYLSFSAGWKNSKMELAAR